MGRADIIHSCARSFISSACGGRRSAHHAAECRVITGSGSVRVNDKTGRTRERLSGPRRGRERRERASESSSRGPRHADFGRSRHAPRLPTSHPSAIITHADTDL
ncbi:hypothetical protein SKAU_G00243150 [Synaphobranchus kaupii]|uniref:Uncharacterized protein n=1 Tax=Synaphobranchus kaupii TaxID=118154 RepID=A0A9Q1IUF6_SYNKA|nr:hypothetical protein SKAU_G00243150 [Synaphobranchus kaupii]